MNDARFTDYEVKSIYEVTISGNYLRRITSQMEDEHWRDSDWELITAFYPLLGVILFLGSMVYLMSENYRYKGIRR